MKQGKVWGETTQLVSSPFVELHEISVQKKQRCSRHHHARKVNVFYVICGALKIWTVSDSGMEDFTLLQANETMSVPAGVVHWFEGVEDSPALALELYYPDSMAGDIVRQNQGGSL